MKELARKFCRNQWGNMRRIFFFLATDTEEYVASTAQLSRILKIPNSTTNDNITKLKGEGLITKRFDLTEKGKKLFHILREKIVSPNLRFHNIQIRFMLSACPKDYVKKYSDKIERVVTNGKYFGFNAILNNATMTLYSRKKIICVLRNVYGSSEEEITIRLQLFVQKLQEEIEERFEGIKIDKNDFCKIQTSHLAIVNSEIAKDISKGKFTYEGKEVAVDESHGRYEIELTNPKTNLNNISSLVKLEESVRQNKGLIDEDITKKSIIKEIKFEDYDAQERVEQYLINESFTDY